MPTPESILNSLPQNAPLSNTDELNAATMLFNLLMAHNINVPGIHGIAMTMSRLSVAPSPGDLFRIQQSFTLTD